MFQINLLDLGQLGKYITLLLAGVGFFLSLWIILPAPTMSLLYFGVGVPELSPWVGGINAIALILILLQFQSQQNYHLAVGLTLIALILSLLPLIEFPAANVRFQLEMETRLGKNYLQQIIPKQKAKMRPQPLSLKDVFLGITLPEVKIKRGIQFANPDNQPLKLNIYQPLASNKDEKYPTLIIIYGGAWRSGNPDDYETFSRYIAAQGYCVITLDYRHAPQYKFPNQLEDIQAALKYISDRTEQWQIDRQRVAIMGRSAGAQLASLVAFQNQAQIKIKSLINYYGPVNLINGYYNPPFPNPINNRQVLEDFLGGTPETQPQLYQQASPINYVKPNLPDSLLIYAGRDHLVKAQFGRNLYQKLQANNNRTVLLEIPWAEHAFDIVFAGVSNQLALYYTERFLAWSLLQYEESPEQVKLFTRK